MIDYVHRLVLAFIFYSRNYEVGSMGVSAGLYMYDVVVKSSCSLSHLLMSSCLLSYNYSY